MKPPNQQPALERECGEVLQQWEDWSETPMLVLSFACLELFIVERVWGLTPILEAITYDRLRQRDDHLDRFYPRLLACH
jgi:voltage-gated potassium channel